jgi:hypothetical protein
MGRKGGRYSVSTNLVILFSIMFAGCELKGKCQVLNVSRRLFSALERLFTVHMICKHFVVLQTSNAVDVLNGEE